MDNSVLSKHFGLSLRFTTVDELDPIHLGVIWTSTNSLFDDKRLTLHWRITT